MSSAQNTLLSWSNFVITSYYVLPVHF